MSSAETSFRILNVRRIEDLAEEGDNKAKKLIFLLKDSVPLLTTIITVKSISIASFITLISYEILKLKLFSTSFNLIFSAFLSTIFVFLFTSLLPKYYAYNNPEKCSFQLYPIVKFFYTVFRPLSFVLSIITEPLLEKIGSKLGRVVQNITTDEIRDMVDISHKTGVLEHYETKIIQSALDVDEQPVSSIITPRVDIEYVAIDTSLKDTLDIMLEQEYSRLPVCEDNIDNIVGIVHIKDLLKVSKAHPDNLGKTVKSFMRKAFHVPESKKIIPLLKEMQAKRVQMAIVSDEYGGTSGLITMEDILETIVGEIRDEHDGDELSPILEVDKNTIIVNAMTSVEDVNRFLDVDLPNNQTIGRLVFELTSELPSLGQEVIVSGVKIKIQEVDGIRVQKFLIKKESSTTKNLSEDELSEFIKNQGN